MSDRRFTEIQRDADATHAHIERHGWLCRTCGHRHTSSFGGICIGCSCARTSPTVEEFDYARIERVERDTQ